MQVGIIEFCEKNGIWWEPMDLRITEDGKKEPMRVGGYEGYMPKTNDYQLDPEVIKARHSYVDKVDYIAVFTNKIQQIDIDMEVGYYDHLREETPYFLSVKKKLPHYFVTVSNAPHKKKIERIGVDILNGQWSYVRKDAIVYNAEKSIQIVDISDEKKYPNYIDKNTLLEYIHMLRARDYHNASSGQYTLWLDLCFGIYNTACENLFENPRDYVVKFCEGSAKYD